MNSIVGVRYIGSKARQTDSVLNTGAVWKPGQVHNFHESMAKQLLRHHGSYEEAPVSAEGDTFLGANHKSAREPVAVVNINAMGKDALALFARHQFNRTVDTEGRSDDDVRTEVHRLMITTNMDDAASEALNAHPDGIPYPLMVSAAEYEALTAGLIVAKLVPAEVADEIPEAITDEKHAQMVQHEAARHESGEVIPTLEQLLESLETKDDLMAFAVQEKIDGLSFRNSVETMRDRIREAITSRASE
ncbi:MAG: hypothetical protein ABFC67_14540 [Mizugakiibacter sp.]|uniref:hypothetical protein n=1 Tax=Mizugakiibacter sp. TaxID=1972610 RepID=UPI00320C6DB5